MKKIGRQVNFIGTSEFNQRNGEGAFIKLKNGSIIFGFTEFVGNDWDDDFCARISYILSNDNGETFTLPEPNMFFSSACSPMLVNPDGSKMPVNPWHP